ncbi:putative phospholipase B-like 2 [Histomonas meleagridis]|uniref:putative phospholipase B-like 2 n=1 Tax=Histomonas meleagridis TaxID=135588 RepID=UPI0035595636|nr:putative phospholipase B-like 2 [Histomonas meleagridis]KAH0800805.1 putative phospholipase B-like 2 [Histomonas meleagridis]
MLFSLLFVSSALSKSLSVYYNISSTSYYAVEDTYDSNAYARALLFDNVQKNGWYDLHVESNGAQVDQIQAYAAGYAEGVINHDFYKNFRSNFITNLCNKYIKCDTQGSLPANVVEWLSQNYDWVSNNIAQSEKNTPFYWAADVFLEQLKGIVAGYNSVDPNSQITILDLWILNSRSEIFNIYRKLNGIDPTVEPVIERRGTSFVTPFGDHENLVIAHSTWASYGDSIKISKRYRLPFHNAYSKIERRSLSSYPFMLHSDQGMTITDHGMIITATSIAIANQALYYQINFQGFPFWLRELIADQTSHNNFEWYDNYKPFQSGCAGIEWTIVNMKQFLYRNAFLRHTVSVVDEIPGSITRTDVTAVAESNGYFASFDVPYDEDIFKEAGYQTLETNHPEFYSYNQSARHKILRDRAPLVKDRESARTLIRYNDVNDPYQAARKDLGISARQENIANAYCAGAVDAKLTTIPKALHLNWEGAIGPNFDDGDKFEFSKYQICQFSKHDGVPDQLAFKWAQHYFDIDL